MRKKRRSIYALCDIRRGLLMPGLELGRSADSVVHDGLVDKRAGNGSCILRMLGQCGLNSQDHLPIRIRQARQQGLQVGDVRLPVRLIDQPDVDGPQCLIRHLNR
jgi:hypothetical protein